MLKDSYLIVRPVEKKKTPDWYEIKEDKATISVHDPLQDTTKSLKKSGKNAAGEAPSDDKSCTYEKYSRIFGPTASIHDVYIGSHCSDYVEDLYKGRKSI